jgi:peroxiredoxin Q/BCP
MQPFLRRIQGYEICLDALWHFGIACTPEFSKVFEPSCILSVATMNQVQTENMSALPIGQKAPDFILKDQNGETFQLSETLKTHAVVLYFYPKDETYGCTKEACFFRDAFEDFVDAGAIVVGVSADSVASHEKFAGHHRLPFSLLSDPDKAVHKLFGVERGFLGLLAARVTFVIDQEAVIRKTFDSLGNFEGHVKESLKVIKLLTANT